MRMDAGERAAARLEDERAEMLAHGTAELLRDLDLMERRIDRLEAILLPMTPVTAPVA
jgi:hypothetical protein